MIARINSWEKESISAGKEDDMILIPSGAFLMGTPRETIRKLSERFGYHPSWFESEAPQREVELPAYKIDRVPVTNRMYHAFCVSTGHAVPRHWKGDHPGKDLLDHPVCSVNHADAKAYARWAGKRLPTEAEWEKAARGTEGRMYPWGNKFDPEACCWERSGTDGRTTDPVDAHPSGASPYGLLDMAGNLFEWCQDGPAGDPLLDRAVRSSAYLKGGAWITTERVDLRCASRGNSGHTNNASTFYGFRCVKDI